MQIRGVSEQDTLYTGLCKEVRQVIRSMPPVYRMVARFWYLPHWLLT